MSFYFQPKVGKLKPKSWNFEVHKFLVKNWILRKKETVFDHSKQFMELLLPIHLSIHTCNRRFKCMSRTLSVLSYALQFYWISCSFGSLLSPPIIYTPKLLNYHGPWQVTNMAMATSPSHEYEAGTLPD